MNALIVQMVREHALEAFLNNYATEEEVIELDSLYDLKLYNHCDMIITQIMHRIKQ